MGLDMYLSASVTVDKLNWAKVKKQQPPSYENPPDDYVYSKFKDIVKRAGLESVHTDVYPARVTVTCAYWRKANQIHGWFVKEIQEGTDDCREYSVSVSSLRELLDLVSEALDKKDATLIPPVEGFFFGGNEVDEGYWQDLEDTKDQMMRILAIPNIDRLQFTYQSSW